jgi:hypothetical protein
LVKHTRRVRPGGAAQEEPLVNIRLDPVLWEALRDVAARQGRTPRELVMDIAQDSLGFAIRVYLQEFYRAIASSEPSDREDDSQP